MAVVRKNITISKVALQQAKELKAAGYASTRSGVLARALNEAWEARNPKSAGVIPGEKVAGDTDPGKVEERSATKNAPPPRVSVTINRKRR